MPIIYNYVIYSTNIWVPAMYTMTEDSDWSPIVLMEFLFKVDYKSVQGSSSLAQLK
jgi:hypothetical protein